MTDSDKKASPKASQERVVALSLFSIIERVLLVVVVLMTLGAVWLELVALYHAGTISLADILLMFLYLEVVGMVAVFYTDKQSAAVFPVYIAITALARLIILQGKDMDPQNILFEAIAILVLAVSATILIRLNRFSQQQ